MFFFSCLCKGPLLFILRVDPFLRALFAGSHQSCLPFVKMAEKHRGVPIPLKGISALDGIYLRNSCYKSKSIRIW